MSTQPGAVTSSVLHTVAQYPLPSTALILVTVVGITLRIRKLFGRSRGRDSQRAFTAGQRLAMFKRAGNQCEFKPVLLPRCTALPTHGDHIYPHSRGGATTMSNAQALCARHNLRKRDKVPSPFYIWRLEKRRLGYFLPGEPVEVIWRQGQRY